jgi:hypothetical protein
MNLADLGNIGEFVGAIGVVITLVYLAYQIRQNTEQLQQNTLAAKAAAVKASIDAIRENRKSVFSDADLSELFRIGLEHPEDLDEGQQFRFRLTIQNVTDSMWDIYTQTVVTDFAPETWDSQGVSLARRILDTAGGRWFWDAFGSTYPSDFREEVDRILSIKTPPERGATERELRNA